MPVVGDRASEDLNPQLFGVIGVEFGESSGDASERIHLKGVESLDWESFVVGKCEFGRIGDLVFFAVIDVVFVDFVDLNSGVLGVDLTLDKTL